MAEADADRESRKKPFFERGSFKAAVALVGLLGGVWALLGAPKPWEVATELAANPLPLRNTEIILDASSRMGNQFRKTSKLAIEAEAVKRLAASGEHMGLALRRAGGSCGEPTEPVVGFDDGQSAEISEAAREQKPEGKSNWGLAVKTAISEFGEERFHRPGAENQIAIFVGGEDECESQVGLEIRNQLQHSNVQATEFQLFAFKVPDREMKQLRAIKQQLGTVAPVMLQRADTVHELYQAVQEEGQGAAAGGGSTEQDSPGGHVVQAGGPPSEEPEPVTDESELEGWSASSSGVIERRERELEEEAAEKLEEEKEKEQKEEEEKEKEEAEAEEEIEVEPAEEAPDIPVEPDGEVEEGDEHLGESKPAPVPEGSSAGKSSLSLFSRNLQNQSMVPSWTLRPSGDSRRGKSPLPYWGSFRGSWPSMPS